MPKSILGISAAQGIRSFLELAYELLGYTYTASEGSGYYTTTVETASPMFVAITSSTMAASSTDGITWTERTLPSSVVSWWSVTYGGGLFVAVGLSSTIAASSTDGITWTQRTMPSSASWTSVAYGG